MNWKGHPPADVRPWRNPLEPLGLLLLQGDRRLVIWPRHRVALVRQEYFGRVEVISAEGDLAHHPGPWEALLGPPLVEAAPGVLANPAHVRQADGVLHVEGGWTAPLQGELPPAAPLPAEEPVPELGLRPSEVLYLRARGKRALWVTDRGEVLMDRTSRSASRLLPGLLKAGRYYVNSRRLAAFHTTARPQRGHLDLDEGTRLTVGWWAARSLMAALDVDCTSWLPPANEGQVHLAQERLRNWPWPLPSAPEEALRREFEGDPERLIANVAWQTVQSLAQGIDPGYGTDHRSYFYDPVSLLLKLARASLGDGEYDDAAPPEPDDVAFLSVMPGPLARYLRYCNVLGRLVMDRRIMVFREMGFRDPRPDLRGAGDRLPQVVLFVEKGTVQRTVDLLRRRLGLSFIVAGGMSRIVGTEHLAERLRPVLQGRPVLVLAYVDYDPWGWAAVRAFVAQLARYGISVSGLRHLVLPARFSPEERRRLSVPLPQVDAARRTYVAHWMELTGGVDGEARGLHSDNLPAERVLQAALEELQAAGIAPELL